MRRSLLALVLLAFVVAVPARAQSPAYEAARDAWAGGDYVRALDALDALLAGPDASSHLAPVALLTGERYATTELAPDGYGVRWSPDGRHAAWESGSGPDVVTHVVAVAPDGTVRPLAEVAGRDLAFGPEGMAAYRLVEATDALTASLAALDSLRAARDYQGFYRERARLARLEAEAARLVVRDLASGAEREIPNVRSVADLAAGPGGDLYVLTGPDDAGSNAILAVPAGGGDARTLVGGDGEKRDPVPLAGGRHLLFDASPTSFGLVDLASGEVRTVEGTDPAASADGSVLAFLGTDDGANTLSVLDLTAPGAEPRVAYRTEAGLERPQPSPDGAAVFVQEMMHHNWEVVRVPTGGGEPLRLTHDVQHDLFPEPFGADGVLVVKGEGRHRRSYRVDLEGNAERLFHNNTIRTVAPEYEWAVSPDGTRLLVVSERDGDTISPERGVYLVDTTRPLSAGAVRARLAAMREGERALRAHGEALFAPIAEAVRAAVADVSVNRIYGYEADLFAFGSKFITEPGNALAIDYLAETLRGFGYEPELQWFEPRPGVRTANVIATLPGTTHPDVHYVVSSHFDSVQRGPGADDNTSGTAALLEAARVLKDRPQGATVHFAFFTGEEAGLLGSREYVRRAVEDGLYLAGALNNDMVGYANDERLDNTIRYSNAGLRDLQHAAAFLFTDLVTYDAKYYKSTDAHAYYEAYGDIVAGIGSYPILANPHYHQATDRLETVNHRLVAEVSKTTVASIMRMASSPGRVRDVAVTPGGEVTWTPAPERDVADYVVVVEAPDGSRDETTVDRPRLTLGTPAPGATVRVWARNARGLASWDAVEVAVSPER